ncbi:MAG: carboxypeptidase regulatory-like domain-containing protein, partial [Bacteroidota bacterium]
MKNVLVIIFSLSTLIGLSQLTQTVRGKVYDAETNYPLAGVRVQIITDDTNARFIGGTDANGEFTLKKIPVGKHKLVS